jgi:hypothetical protein
MRYMMLIYIREMDPAAVPAGELESMGGATDLRIVPT